MRHYYSDSRLLLLTSKTRILEILSRPLQHFTNPHPSDLGPPSRIPTTQYHYIDIRQAIRVTNLKQTRIYIENSLNGGCWDRGLTPRNIPRHVARSCRPEEPGQQGLCLWRLAYRDRLL
ncbi:hypothetical protein CC79DRAFT_286400 [Sarocladium strictum]